MLVGTRAKTNQSIRTIVICLIFQTHRAGGIKYFLITVAAGAGVDGVAIFCNSGRRYFAGIAVTLGRAFGRTASLAGLRFCTGCVLPVMAALGRSFRGIGGRLLRGVGSCFLGGIGSCFRGGIGSRLFRRCLGILGRFLCCLCGFIRTLGSGLIDISGVGCLQITTAASAQTQTQHKC